MLKSNYTYGESQQLFKHVNNLNRNLRLFYATEKVGGHMSFSLFFFLSPFSTQCLSMIIWVSFRLTVLYSYQMRIYEGNGALKQAA